MPPKTNPLPPIGGVAMSSCTVSQASAAASYDDAWRREESLEDEETRGIERCSYVTRPSLFAPPVNEDPFPSGQEAPADESPRLPDDKTTVRKSAPVNLGVRSPPARLANDELRRTNSDPELGGNGVLADPVAREVQNRMAQVAFVNSLPLQIQRAFRRKLLLLLWIQLGITLAASLLIRYAIPAPGIAAIFPAQSPQALALCFFTGVALTIPSALKDKHPWNLITTFLWTLMLATALAASQVPGGFVNSNSMYWVFSNIFGGIGIVMVLSTSITFTNEWRETHLMSFLSAGCIAWPFMLTGSIIFLVNGPDFGEPPHFVGAFLFSTCVFAWVCYDAGALCARMQPDEYMKGVIYFYADFFWCCMCCAILSVFGGAGAN